ncbi:hypothetical protein GCM10009111_27040 [Colwellia asteriadis]|uniref:DUF4282 domain-containing protein n=1 Tax=Colwellia asteriadis TaxID=517723 RepID=A0ABP3WJN9_9GAMM
MRSIFFFDSMLTPKIITFIYWLMLLGVVISGITTMFSGYDGISFLTFITGFLFIIGGAIGARVWCELMIVLFKIHGNLQKIADKSE